MGRKVSFHFPPQKIVSLVPSQTELLFNLNLEKETIGISKFCIHPASWHKNKKRIGGTKKINIDTIKKLQPDLIIGNKEENEKEQIELLEKSFPVWMSDINNTNDALQMILQIGDITNKSEEALNLKNDIAQLFLKHTPSQNSIQTLRTLYFIWNKPYMLAGKNTFIDAMLQYCNLNNIAPAERYPKISIEEIKNLKPDVILLSSEPFPFKKKHIIELKKELPQTKITIVNGEMFSWYGSRLLYTPAYLKSLAEQLNT